MEIELSKEELESQDTLAKQSDLYPNSSDFSSLENNNGGIVYEYLAADSKTSSSAGITSTEIANRASNRSKKNNYLFSSYGITHLKPSTPIKICNILSGCGMREQMQLFGDLSISQEGIVRMMSTLNNTTLGYFPTSCDQVSFQKNASFANLRFVPKKSLRNQKTHSTIDAIQLLQQLPEPDYIISLLLENDRFIDEIIQEISKISISKQLLEHKDMQFQRFIDYCFQFLQDHDKLSSSSSMYSFVIGRVNLSERDFDFPYAGYSANFLELLGIDEQSLSTISLRNKQIDLVLSKSSLIEQTIKMLFERNQHHKKFQCACEIITFDGFPIKLLQSVSKMAIPEQFTSILRLAEEFMFVVTEIDVEIDSLRQLIEYRQQFVKNEEADKVVCSMESFIQKELSFKFEDVEYSILSENFIEKYYKKNVEQMKGMEESKILRNRCKYRILK